MSAKRISEETRRSSNNNNNITLSRLNKRKDSDRGYTKTRHITRFTNKSMFSNNFGFLLRVVLVGLVILVVFQLSQTVIRAPKELSSGGAFDDPPHLVGATSDHKDTEKLVVSQSPLSCNVLPNNSSGIRIGGVMGTLPFRPNCKTRVALQDTEKEHPPNNTNLAFVNETQLLPDLLSFFGSHNVALVGDSLTVQHFETLVQRLQWRSQCFAHGSTPPRILRARQQYRLEFSDFVFGKVGYLAATPKSTPINAQRNNCTQLEFFKLQNLQKTKNVTQLLEFLFEESDIVIFNVGVHYRRNNSYKSDMQQIFQACGVVNQNQNTNNNTNNKHCFFRETLPQHTQPNKKKFDVFPANWKYNDADTEHGCGGFQPTVHSIVFQSRDWLTNLSETHGVPVIRVMDEFVEAHRWHSDGKGDCTHYCQDNMVWDIFHRKVLDVIMQVALLA